HSTAARAREILALQAGESGDTRQPFGRTVSQVARGLLSIDDVVALQAETAETDDPASGTAGEQPGAAADAPETPDDSTAGTGTEGAPASFAGTADTQNVLADALEDLLTGETDEPTAV
ncbi:MAG: hypothetical protein VW644_07485, partial [Alphaproteobacteria bacterium]